MLFAGDQASARPKGVEALFLQLDEQDFFDKVLPVSPYRREDGWISLGRRLELFPIHVYLNTKSLDRYERTRPCHQTAAALLEHRHDGTGTRTALEMLLGLH